MPKVVGQTLLPLQMAANLGQPDMRQIWQTAWQLGTVCLDQLFFHREDWTLWT